MDTTSEADSDPLRGGSTIFAPGFGWQLRPAIGLVPKPGQLEHRVGATRARRDERQLPPVRGQLVAELPQGPHARAVEITNPAQIDSQRQRATATCRQQPPDQTLRRAVVDRTAYLGCRASR